MQIKSTSPHTPQVADAAWMTAEPIRQVQGPVVPTGWTQYQYHFLFLSTCIFTRNFEIHARQGSAIWPAPCGRHLGRGPRRGQRGLGTGEHGEEDPRVQEHSDLRRDHRAPREGAYALHRGSAQPPEPKTIKHPKTPPACASRRSSTRSSTRGLSARRSRDAYASSLGHCTTTRKRRTRSAWGQPPRTRRTHCRRRRRSRRGALTRARHGGKSGRMSLKLYYIISRTWGCSLWLKVRVYIFERLCEQGDGENPPWKMWQTASATRGARA
jgi:hypothetical protein